MRHVVACLWIALALTGCRQPAASPVSPAVVASPAAPVLSEALGDRARGDALIGQAGGTLIGQAGGNLVENAAQQAPTVIADASVPGAGSGDGSDAEDADDEEAKESDEETAAAYRMVD